MQVLTGQNYVWAWSHPVPTQKLLLICHPDPWIPKGGEWPSATGSTVNCLQTLAFLCLNEQSSQMCSWFWRSFLRPLEAQHHHRASPAIMKHPCSHLRSWEVLWIGKEEKIDRRWILWPPHLYHPGLPEDILSPCSAWLNSQKLGLLCTECSQLSLIPGIPSVVSLPATPTGHWDTYMVADCTSDYD